jgi:hypothetical protein
LRVAWLRIEIALLCQNIGNLRRALGGRHLAECSGGARPEQWFTSPCFHQRGWRVLHCSRVEAVSSREKKNAKFGITNARGIFQYGLEYRLQLTARARDDAQHLCGRRLLLQRLGKVPPRLGEFTGARFELLFQLDQ